MHFSPITSQNSKRKVEDRRIPNLTSRLMAPEPLAGLGKPRISIIAENQPALRETCIEGAGGTQSSKKIVYNKWWRTLKYRKLHPIDKVGLAVEKMKSKISEFKSKTNGELILEPAR